MTGRIDAFAEKLKQLDDNQLIDRFNGDVNNPGWTGARADFYNTMRSEFIRRGLDFSEIGRFDTLSIAAKIRLEGNVIRKI